MALFEIAASSEAPPSRACRPAVVHKDYARERLSVAID